MDSKKINFIIIGSMKCGTSVLAEQLASQQGIFITNPKEPNFFSDNPDCEQNIDWYKDLFNNAGKSDICGEASTHYTKMPTYLGTAERIYRFCPNAKLIYVMRHPVDRLISQYIHEWTELNTSAPLGRAIDNNKEWIDYGRYYYQLEPYLNLFGKKNILPVFAERVKKWPEEELVRITSFIGYSNRPIWNKSIMESNVSSERLRKNDIRDAVVENPIVKIVRKKFVPKVIRNKIKSFWQIRKKPVFSKSELDFLKSIYNEDMFRLGSLFGINLNVDNYKEIMESKKIEWM